ENLRHGRPPDAVDVGELRALSRGLQELLEVLVQEIDRAAAPVLEPEREAAAGAEALNRGGRKRERVRLGDLAAKLAVETLHDRADLHLLALALVPGIERHEVEAR